MDPRIVVAPTARDADARAALVALGRRRGFRRFALPDGESPDGPGDAPQLTLDDGVLAPRDGSGDRWGIVEIRGPDDLARALALLPARGPLVVRWAEERLIPLENLLAERPAGRPVWVVTDRPREVPGALGALEAGADAVVVEVAEPAGLDALLEALEPTGPVELAWEAVAVRRVVAAGLGDRVIVDTTSILGPSEGLLVGSSAAFLLHVPSEAEGSRFTRPRPFRVNAGSAHSYVLRADGSTRYLAELAPGDALLAARPPPEGGTRPVRVGRLKVERRPMVLVEVERRGRPFTVFLQEAETVRLSGPDGRRPTTGLEPGHSVFGVDLPAARHLGRAIEETIDER